MIFSTRLSFYYYDLSISFWYISTPLLLILSFVDVKEICQFLRFFHVPIGFMYFNCEIVIRHVINIQNDVPYIEMTF
jgi:hypothetical protein